MEEGQRVEYVKRDSQVRRIQRNKPQQYSCGIAFMNIILLLGTLRIKILIWGSRVKMKKRGVNQETRNITLFQFKIGQIYC